MKEYIEHIAGFALLLDWQSRWHNLSDDVVVTRSGLELGKWVSQRFLLGAPRRPRYGKGVFLGAQSVEAEWLSRIRWKRAVLQLDTPAEARLTLVAARQFGDGKDLTDLPGFTVSFPILDANLAEVLTRFRFFEGRFICLDEEELVVDSGPPMFHIPLVVQSVSVPILNDNEAVAGRTIDDLINERMAATNREQPGGIQVVKPQASV